jgi:hypothetical protein
MLTARSGVKAPPEILDPQHYPSVFGRQCYFHPIRL